MADFYREADVTDGLRAIDHHDLITAGHRQMAGLVNTFGQLTHRRTGHLDQVSFCRILHANCKQTVGDHEILRALDPFDIPAVFQYGRHPKDLTF